MTDTSLDLNENTIIALFERGDCLTFDPLEPMEAFKFAKALQREYQKKNPAAPALILSKTARFCPDGGYTPPFHYFSDGTLLHRFYSEDEKRIGLSRIKNMLIRYGCQIVREYGPRNLMDREYDAFLRDISAFARQKHPYQEDLYATSLPDKETFVRDCFENGNVLLTASKDERTPPEYRKILALFSDGRFFVSDKYADKTGINDPLKIYDFKHECRTEHFLFLQRIYVPESYLEALYDTAVKYDWYLSPQDASKRLNVQTTPSDGEKQEMEAFIDSLLDGRACVSVTIPDPSDEYISPDRENFVLFSDGTLVLDSRKKGIEDIFCKHFRRPFPQMEFNIRFVPDFYIPEIYKRLLKKQKSARQIYLEMLKQKARKLKKKLNIPHHEALELVAAMAGWPNWKAATVIEEKQARHVICAEQIKKKLAERFENQDPVEWEYQEYLKKNKKRLVSK